MTELPVPLTPADCDLQEFSFMPLDVARLRDSDIAVHTTGDQFRCAVLLWCASWHQVPAASLPDDDIVLAGYAGFGRVVKEWKKVKAGAMRGWIKCSDGRFYHPVVAEKANEAWQGRLEYRDKKEAERLRKAALRAAQKAAESPPPPLENPLDDNHLSAGQNNGVRRTDPYCPPENALKETVDSGQQTVDSGKGQLTTNPPSSSEPQNPLPPATASGRDDSGQNRNVEISILLRAHGVKPMTAMHPMAIDWANDPKITNAILLEGVQDARVYKPDGSISPNYLAPIIQQLLQPKGPQFDNTWKSSDQATDAMGRELNMPARPSESYAEYRNRLSTEIAKRRKGNPPAGDALR